MTRSNPQQQPPHEPVRLKDKVLSRLEHLNVSAIRALGQNFLVNAEVVTKIAEQVANFKTIDQSRDRVIVEIGPGPGSLTDALIATNHELHLVELDRNWAQFWRDKGVSVNETDAMDIDWRTWPPSAGSKDLCIVGNLPYQISSRLLIELGLRAWDAKLLVFMFQKEVADRITAKPKSADYGLLSVFAQVFYSIESVVRVGTRDFYPSPKVQSKVLCFERRAEPAIKNVQQAQRFLEFLKILFKMRRKTLLNNLKGMTLVPKALLDELGISPQARAEQLSVNEVLKLFLKREERLGK